MVEIRIDNAFSHVKASYEVFQELRDHLSYEVEGATFAKGARPGWDGKKRLLGANGMFPTGLLVPLVMKCKQLGVEYKFQDSRSKPENFHKMNLQFPDFFEDRDYQITAEEITDKFSRGVYVVGTGGGKTNIAARIINRKAVDTLFVTPDTGLREQASQDFKEWFADGMVSTDINSSAPIVVSNIQALARKDKEAFKRFKMLIIDEFHHAAAKSYKFVNQCSSNAFFRYGFTGTFMRSDGADMEMHGVLSKVIFEKTTSELIEEGHLVRPYITIYEYKTKPEYGYRCNYKTAYDHIVTDHGFHTLVSDIAAVKLQEGKQTLVLVRRKEHGKELSEMIDGSIFLSGDDPSDYREQCKKDFNDKKIPCLIATNIFGEGTDIPSIEVLINARCQKTEIQTAQGIGRALRKHPGKEKAEVFDFMIEGQKHLKEHSVERLQSYKKHPAFRITLKKSTGI